MQVSNYLDLDAHFSILINDVVLPLIKIVDDANEKYFQSVIGSIIEINYLISPKISTYRMSMEKLIEGNKVDSIFYNDNRAVIHEYKFTRDSNTKEKLLLDGLWQIITKYLLDPVVHFAKNDNDNANIKIIIRVIVIHPSQLSNQKWQAHIYYKRMKYHEASNIVNLIKSINESFPKDIKKEEKASTLKTYLLKDIEEKCPKAFLDKLVQHEYVEEDEPNINFNPLSINGGIKRKAKEAENQPILKKCRSPFN
jgi:RNAse (barnase) inhibitor barstar